MRKSAITLMLLALALAGCANDWVDTPPHTPPGGTALAPEGVVVEGFRATASIPRPPVHNSAGVVPPYGATGWSAAYEFRKGYRIGSGDRLQIRVVGQRDLTATPTVTAAGNISMPLIKIVHVAGKTAPQVEHIIAARLRQGFLRDPSVSVEVVSQRPFFILGEVNQAGGFSYQPGMTVQSAVALAGGYTPRANHGAVMLTRRSIDGTETSKVPITTQLYPGDIIYVRERWF